MSAVVIPAGNLMPAIAVAMSALVAKPLVAFVTAVLTSAVVIDGLAVM